MELIKNLLNKLFNKNTTPEIPWNPQWDEWEDQLLNESEHDVQGEHVHDE